MPQNHDSDDVLLPPWADRLAHGDYRVVGAMLPTRDGRKMGNAVVIAWTAPEPVDPADVGPHLTVDNPYLAELRAVETGKREVVATIRTDAGNEARMTERELAEQFWPPTWVRKLSADAENVNHSQKYTFEIGTEKLVENGDDQGQAILSIAASLKRISDMGPVLGEVGWHLKRIADVVDPVDRSRGDFFQQADNWFHTWLGAWIRSR